MTKLVFVQASLRGEQSKSVQVAQTYFNALQDQSTSLKAWLNQAGVIAIDEVRFQPTLLTPDPQGALEQAKRAAVDLAKHARAS